MARKLPAVVTSQGMDIIRQGGKLLQDGHLDRIRLLAGDPGNQRQARLTFGQGHEGLFVPLTNHRIQFPIDYACRRWRVAPQCKRGQTTGHGG